MVADTPLRLAPTKIRPPLVDGRLARRPRLERMLDGDARISLIVAPAGYGKTVAAAQWAAGCGVPIAWFTVDEHDDTPAGFWRYVAGALAKATDRVGGETTGAIAEWAIDGIDMVGVLLAEMGDDGPPVVLVLDDVHQVSSPAIIQQLTFFLERAPAWLHVVLVSRSVPKLPIARWRSQHLLAEVRQDDLMLQVPEAQDVLRGMEFLDLDESTERRLIELAAGWPAALQLAGLSLRDRADADTLVREHLASDRALFDFVVGEVLDRLSPATRRAVLELSVLDDIDARRCEALTGVDDGEALLAELVGLGLPIVAIGVEGRTFRFHHLFRALVRLELGIREAALVESLHRKAAAAELEAGDHPAAVRHLLAVGDHAAAFDLVVSPVWDLYRVGSMHEVGMWLDQFPPDFVGTDPHRITQMATTLSLAGRLMEAEMWNERATTLAAARGIDVPDLVLSKMLVHLGHADTDAVRDEAPGYADLDDITVITADPEARFSSILAIAALLDGRPDEASKWIGLIATTRLRPERLRAVGFPARAAWLAFEQGALDHAERLADQGLDGAGVDGRGAPHALIELAMTKARVAVERVDLAEARRWAESAMELAARAGSPLRPMLHHELAHEAMLETIELEAGPAAAMRRPGQHVLRRARSAVGRAVPAVLDRPPRPSRPVGPVRPGRWPSPVLRRAVSSPRPAWRLPGPSRALPSTSSARPKRPGGRCGGRSRRRWFGIGPPLRQRRCAAPSSWAPRRGWCGPSCARPTSSTICAPSWITSCSGTRRRWRSPCARPRR